MATRGFSLVELLVVITLIGMLLALAVLNFSKLQQQALLEKQTKELYSDLVEIRQAAMHTKMEHDVHFASGSRLVFRRYSSEADVSGNILMRKDLHFPLTRSPWTTPTSDRIRFNSYGLMTDIVQKSICADSTVGPSVDSVVLIQSRISMGKMKVPISKGGTCGGSNIDIK